MLPIETRSKINAAPHPVTVPGPDITFGRGALAFLDHLRFVAMQCRAKPRTDLFEACALLQTEATASRDAHTDALMRCLGEALGTPARLHAPGTAEVTFDEQWLMRLGMAFGNYDEDSQRFLLNSRVAFENRRLVRYLIGTVAAFFPLN